MPLHADVTATEILLFARAFIDEFMASNQKKKKKKKKKKKSQRRIKRPRTLPDLRDNQKP